MSRTRVLLACAGLEHARRGFESFARECFEALREDPGLDIRLVKGSGPTGPGEGSIATLRRDRPAARAIGRALHVRAFRIEAAAFAASLQPVLLRGRPEVVFVSEWDTARVLAMLRRLTGQRFKLLLSNGSFAAEGFEHLDHVQELTPAALQYVLERGADPRSHTVLPLGFHIDESLVLPSGAERAALRQRLGLPVDRHIVISVAALNRHHKRLDYLIEELAAAPQPRPFLLMVGEPEGETPGLRSLARERLGKEGFEMRTVPAPEVLELLRAGDTFVLASVAEMQGRALIEAAAVGLPCIAHDYGISRYALGDHGLYGDLSRRGTLTRLLLERERAEPQADRERSVAAHRHVYERFSWQRLRPRYVELLTAVANNTVSSSTAEKLSR